jgi:hypothetical protein
MKKLFVLITVVLVFGTRWMTYDGLNKGIVWECVGYEIVGDPGFFLDPGCWDK